MAALVRKSLPLYTAALRKLSALRPPGRDAAQARAWLAADRRTAAALRTLGDAAQRRDYPAVVAATARLRAAQAAGRRAAATLGLKVCARPSGR